MNAQSSGSFDVSSDSNYVLGAVASRPISSISYTNQTITYQSNAASSYTSDILFMVSSLSYTSLTENLYLEIAVDLTCSSSGSTSISYSLSDYYGNSLPSWISFDSTNGVLKITIPSYTSTTYLFSIDSTVSGVSTSIPKLVYLKSNKWSSSHWKQCTTTSYTTWDICNYGYVVSNGNWIDEQSDSVKSASIVTKSVTGMTFGLSIGLGLLSNSSISSFWSMINQLQLFFLLLLTKSYFPQSIINIVVGSDFAQFNLNFLPFGQVSSTNYLIDWFDWDQNDDVLYKIGVGSWSSFVNTYSYFSHLLLVIFIHILFALIYSLSKWWNDHMCKCKILNWIMYLSSKIVNFLTFGYYIRALLEACQFLLITSVSEINNLFYFKSFIFSINYFNEYFIIKIMNVKIQS